MAKRNSKTDKMQRNPKQVPRKKSTKSKQKQRDVLSPLREDCGGENMIRCKVCRAYVTTRSAHQLMLHISDHEEEAKRYGCPGCTFKSAVSAGIANHVIRHHKMKREDIVDRRGEDLYALWRSIVLQCFPDYTESFELYILSETAMSASAKTGQYVKPCYPNLYRNTIPNPNPQNVPDDSQQPALPLQNLQQPAPGPVRSIKKEAKVAKENKAKATKEKRANVSGNGTRPRSPMTNNLPLQYPYGGYIPFERYLQQQLWMAQGLFNLSQRYNFINRNFNQHFIQNRPK